MKFTYSWLKDHLDTKLSIYKISDLLTNIGLEVENIEDNSRNLKPFTVALVLDVEKHPNADRLKICKIKSKAGNFQIICGAPNVRKGMKGIFAPEGSYIPGTEMLLKKTKIRGIDSNGMLVSEKEMGISDDHDKIIEVDESYKIGESIINVFNLDDPVFEVNITPNRGDCLSVRGIARDLAAAGAGKFKRYSFNEKKGNFKSSIIWCRSKEKDMKILTPCVAGRYFKNVQNGQSPEWLKKRLIAIGLRPISRLVDITNYITFDLGRPLHVFDADKINGNLSMRLAKEGEKIKTLDGKSYNLKSSMVVIADNKQAHAIGGVIGGEYSGCDENTTNVFLEVALFNPVSISRTGRKLNLQSDARFRFERGLDPYSVEFGLDAATKMINDLCGGDISYITQVGNYKKTNKVIKYNLDKIQKLGGVEVNKKLQKKILSDLGFKIIKEKKNEFMVMVPSYRPDIDGEADLVEEILRIYGYNNIPALPIIKEKSDSSKPLTNKQALSYRSKKIISTRGLLEVVTWSFMSSRFSNYFSNYKKSLILDNPISHDLNVMRPSIIPNLLNSMIKNQSLGFNSSGIFEVGSQYEDYSFKGQHMMASGIRYGNINSTNWNEKERNVDVFDIKTDVYNLLSSLEIKTKNLDLNTIGPKWYHPGKSASLKIGNDIIGFFGELAPNILNVYETKSNVYAFEIFLNKLQKYIPSKSNTKKPFDNNPYQIVERDFAFIVDKKIRSSHLLEAIRKIKSEFIKNIIIFDIYEGNNIPEGKKSIAIRVVLQPKIATFTEEDIEKISEIIISQVNTSTKSFIRK